MTNVQTIRFALIFKRISISELSTKNPRVIPSSQGSDMIYVRFANPPFFFLRKILVLVPSRIQHFPRGSRNPAIFRGVRLRSVYREDANRTWPAGASRSRGDLHIPCFSISVRGGGIPHLAFRGKYYTLVTPERGRSETTVPFPTAISAHRRGAQTRRDSIMIFRRVAGFPPPSHPLPIDHARARANNRPS